VPVRLRLQDHYPIANAAMLPRVHARAALAAGAVIAGAIIAGPAAAQSARPLDARLDSIAADGLRYRGPVGIVAAVVKGSDTLLMKGYGKANLEWDVPMVVDAMFEVGSIAKQFAATAILQLRDAGRLSLDDDITKWLPDLDTRGTKVTLRRMLDHTSGMVTGHAGGLFDPRLTRDSAYRLIKRAPVDFKFSPGEAQAYDGGAYWLLGLVVEQASGMRYEDYMEKKIFEPLGMTRSMYCNSAVHVPRRAHGYQFVNGVFRRPPAVVYGLVFAAGAICSTAGDLITWLTALHGGKVLSPQSYSLMTTRATLADGHALQYGMGIKVGEDYEGRNYIGHGGSAPGFRAEAMWYPDAKIAVVVLGNTTSLPAAELARELVGAALPPPRPTTRFYMGDATPFVGKYEYVIGGNRSISIEVMQSPRGLAFAPSGGRAEPLPWVGGLTFYASEDVTLTFRRARGDSGPVTELRRDDGGNLYILRKQP
jgi:CubicO group peptidase (beta-lactamase class C family)